MKTITFDPAQWKLVPKEPTDDMRFATTHVNSSLDADDVLDMLRAAIAAAPSAPEQPIPLAPGGVQALADVTGQSVTYGGHEVKPKQEGLTDLPRLVYEAVGEASMQWDPRPAGTFDSQGASVVCDKLIADIRALLASQSKIDAHELVGLKPMTNERAAYFMERFKREEKLLGPNEQAAVDYVLALLASQPATKTANAEEYLRGKYGAYRGHPAWRELEEAFNAGMTSQSAAPDDDHRQRLIDLLQSEFACYATSAGVIPWAINALLDNSPHRMGKPAAPIAVQDDAVRDAAIEFVAKLIEKKIADYDGDHGNTDPETGVREYPGNGIEWVHEMDELAEEIRALKSTKPSAAPVEAAAAGPSEWGNGEVPYLIVFDDHDRKNELVIGDWRAAERFKQISDSWNAHLFVKIASNSRDDKMPNYTRPPVLVLTDERIDELLEPLMRASGTSLHYFTLQKSRDDIRAAMRAAIEAAKEST